MPLSIRQSDTEGIVILDLDGRLVAGPEVVALREHFKELLTAGRSKIVVNLKSVQFIDSTGLGALVLGHSQAKEAGGVIKLLHISERSAQLLVLTKLSTVFEIYDDQQSAINSFFPGRAIRSFDILEFVKSQTDPAQSD
jgi:anti-sigma B factor antagonist